MRLDLAPAAGAKWNKLARCTRRGGDDLVQEAVADLGGR
jgi:hypothetical protein